MSSVALQLAILANEFAKGSEVVFINAPPPLELEDFKISTSMTQPNDEPWRKQSKYGGISQSKRRKNARRSK
jgi:hypothetical protein